MKRIYWWGLIAILALVLLCGTILAAFTPSLAQPRKLGGAIDAMNVRCDEIAKVTTTFDKLADAPEQSGMHNVLVWKWDVKTPEQTQTVRVALNRRLSDCAGTSGSSPAKATSDRKYVGWDQVVANPPVQLKDVLTEGGSTKLSWANVQKWANVTHPDGGQVDARVVLVFGLPTLSDAAARKAANVDSKAVPVAHIKRCTIMGGNTPATPFGCPKMGTEVILAPIQMSGGTTPVLAPGSGVVIAGTEVSIISYAS